MDKESKQQCSQMGSLQVKKAINDNSLADYKKELDDMGFKAMVAGLTPAILEKLFIEVESND